MSTLLATLPQHLSAQTRWMSPLGEMLLARTPTGLAGAWFDGQKEHPGPLPAPELPDDPLLLKAIGQLDHYFGHPRPAHPVMPICPAPEAAGAAAEAFSFDLPLDLHGTPFQRAVWQALLNLAPGQTCSYSDIARQVGAPAAVRAVGAAVGKNPVSVIVPCHRVLGRDGSLTGYAGGLARKRALLSLEGHR